MSAIEFFYFVSTRQLRTKTVKNDTAQKWTFPSRISLVNVTKHASLMQNFIFRASVKTSLDEFLLLFYDVFFYNYFIEFVSPF